MRSTATRNRLAAAGPVLAICVVYAAYAFSHLGGLRWNFDEGITVHKAWLLLDGHPLYGSVWSDQPPGHSVLVMLAFRLLGVDLAAARSVSVVHGMVGLLAVAWGARELVLAVRPEARRTSRLAAAAAAAVLVAAPNFVWASRAAMIGINTFSLATLSVVLTFSYQRTGSRRWLFFGALALGLSLWEKLQMIYLGPALGLAVLARRWADGRGTGRAKATAGDLGLLALGSLGPLAASLLAYPTGAILHQVLGTYFETRASYPVSFADNLALLWTWVSSDNGGLTALAAVGAIMLLRRPTQQGFLALGWVLLTILTALQHAPLWLEDHFEPLMFGLATLAGAGVALGLRDALHAFGRRRGDGVAQSATALALMAAGLVYAVYVPHVLAIDRQLGRARDYENDGHLLTPTELASTRQGEVDMLSAADFLAANSAPSEYVICDDQIIAFLAGRHVPPELAALSSRRIRLREISGSELISITQRYRPAVILAWKGQLTHFDSYAAWIRENYEPGPVFTAESRPAYVRP